MSNMSEVPAGWYHAAGDPEGTERYWDGAQWIGEPRSAPTPGPPVQPPQADAAGAETSPRWGDPTGAAPPGSGFPPPAAAVQSPSGDVSVYSPAGRLGEGWQRLVARLVDGMITGVASFVIGLIVGAVMDNVIGGILAGLAGTAVSLVYEVLMTTKSNATVGKQIFNLRIVNLDGSRVDENAMIKRSMPLVAIGVLGAFPIIGFFAGILGLIVVILSVVWVFTDTQRRSVLDRVGETNVIVDP